MRFSTTLALTCIALSLFASPASNGAEAAKKNATPADAIAAAEQAFDRNDKAAQVDCLSPAGQTALSEMLVMVAGMAAADPGAKEMQRQIDELFARHGVTDRKAKEGEDPQAHAKRIASQIKDKRPFLVDALKLNLADEPAGTKCVKGELKDVKITGDTATGTYAVKTDDSSTMSQEMKFSRSNGSWLIDSLIGLVPARQK